MMTGTGELSDDGKVMTWKYDFNCPLTKKAVVMREVETDHRPEHQALRDVRPRPEDAARNTKMMTIEFTKKS